MSRVLVVEDDSTILRGLTDSLRLEGHTVVTATDGEKGYRLAMERKPDLIILDLMLPKLSGLEIVRKLRSQGITAPILILTACGGETDQVQVLDLGADDYMTKPFSIRTLLARVRALLRRGHSAGPLPRELRFDDVVVDFRGYEALRNGDAIGMTRKEFGILRSLAAKPGQVVTREALLNEVWGYESYPTTRTVDSHLANLRAKVEVNPSEPRRLVTVFGVGYKLVLS